MVREKLKVTKEAFDVANIVIKWGVLAIGALCLFAYSAEIEYLVEDISIGDGLAFYLISVGFLMAYAVYWLVNTSMGCVLASIAAQLLQRFFLKKDSKKPPHLNVDYSVMRPFPVVGIAIAGFGATAIAIHRDEWSGWMFVASSFVQGLMFVLMLSNKAKLDSGYEGIIAVEGRATLNSDKAADIRFVQKTLLAVVVITPLFLAPDKMFLVDGAFRITQLRVDSATVHVKDPWTERMKKSGLAGQQSFLGSDFTQYENVPVLLKSLGKKVVIKLPSKQDGKLQKLAIPSDAIYVE